MKKHFYLLVTLLCLTACGTSKFEDNDFVEFETTSHWVIINLEEATEEEMVAYAKTNANPMKNAYFYFFKKDSEINNLSNLESLDDVHKSFPEKPILAFFFTGDKTIKLETQMFE